MDYPQSLIEHEMLRRRSGLVAQVAPSGLDASDKYIYGVNGIPMRIRSEQEIRDRNNRIINHPSGMPGEYYNSFPSV